VVALAVIFIVAGWRLLPFAAPALTAAVLGAVVVSQFGPVHYYAHLFDALRSESKATAPPPQASQNGGEDLGPISSIHLRQEWIRQALDQFPDKLVFGHGMTMLVDQAPESKRMGTAGEKIWPHNDFAEAAHALGLLGLVPFLLLVGVPAVALVWLRRWTDRRHACVLAGVFAFAFAESNFSGEIGSDTLLWATAAFVVAQWADSSRVTTS
jgi:O-antigen ligase